MHKVVLIILFAWIAFAAQAETVYEWRDAQGEEHMSDTPPPPDQQGVTMRRVNGREVNSFDMGVSASDEAAPAASDNSPPAESSGMESPEAEAQCQREYGGPCHWVHNWEDYGNAECARTRDARCNDRQYFENSYRPRPVSERREGETDGSYEAVQRSADTVSHGRGSRR
jgi:Domain of unknown function (DUF4124)